MERLRNIAPRYGDRRSAPGILIGSTGGLLLLGLITAVQVICGWALAGDGGPTGRLDYAVIDEAAGEHKGAVRLEISEKPGRLQWREVRTFESVKTDRFDVTFDPNTLLPIQYERRMQTKQGGQILRLEVQGDELVAMFERTTGGRFTQRLALPPGEVVIEPLLKYYLSRVCQGPATKGRFTLIVWLDDELERFRLKWEIKEREMVEVPAGRFECVRLEVSSVAWYLRLITPSRSVWLHAADGHAIVRTTVQRSLLAEEWLMVLSRRQMPEVPSSSP